MRRSKTATALALAGALVVGLLVPVVAVSPASAADGANFDPGMIISDDTFYNAGAMNAGQVQAFLNEKGSSCRANALPCVKDITLSYAGRAADQYCGALPAATGVRAADMLVAVAVACNINPQVLLVLVEKEQSLVSRSNPSDYSYRYATGFACPDSPPGCDDALSGFVTQVYLAAKQFNRYRLNPGSYNHQAGRVNNILFNPNPACGASGVFIQNQATAGLYNYTPYQPNASALANLYGTGDGCGSYGNRNFWRMFTDWFGSNTNLLASAGFDAGGVDRWEFVNGPLNRVVGGPGGAQAGLYFLALHAPRSLSTSQDVPMFIQPNDHFTGSIWVKSDRSSTPYTGTLALWALGGQQEVALTRFTVGDQWTQVSVNFPIRFGGHSAIRFEIYMDTPNAVLHLDTTSLSKTVPQLPVTNLALQSPSFEQGIANWEFKNGFMNRAVYEFGAGAQDGSWVLAANTSEAGRSVGQDVTIVGAPGQSYTASVWLRASDAAQTSSGVFALWGLGSGVQLAKANYTVGTTWTQVSTTLTLTQATTSTLRFEVYLGSTNGDLYLDNASLQPNLAPNPSFEQSAGQWNSGISQDVLQVVGGSAEVPAVDGLWYATTGDRLTGGSIATDSKRKTAVGESYTATIWLRAEAVDNTWDGTLALWGIGGTTEGVSMPISVGAAWTQYSITLPVGQPSHDVLRLEVYTGSPGEVLLVDGIMVR
jgi:hypothetical protein